MIDHEFLNRWEPEVIEPKAESKYDAPKPSSLCKECRKLGEDLVCEVRGFQMDMAPPVYACISWEGDPAPKKEMKTVEIARTFTIKVRQVVKVEESAAGNVEEMLRRKTLWEIGKEVEAALGADGVTVTEHKVEVLA